MPPMHPTAVPTRPAPRHWLAGVLILALVLSGCISTGPPSQSAILRAKDRVAPALVHIRPVKEVFQRGQRREVATIGSGFIVSPDGYVLTNEHVAGESRFVRCVLFDREEVEAQVVGVDSFTDIALLKLDVEQPLPYVTLGDSDGLEAGQVVLALGSPHGLARSVSMGIISVTERYLDGSSELASPYNTWIQTDAAINPGNSGGPLVNLRGEVIGVNARRLRGADNVGFAIPVNVARAVMDELRVHGRVRRAWLGLELQEMLARTEDSTQRGVVVGDVDPLSPARAAGLQPGDVLAAVNGTPVHARFAEDLPAVRQQLAHLPIGEPVSLTVRRGTAEQTLAVTTAERGAMKEAEEVFEAWGITASNVPPGIARRAQLPDRAGVLVSGVQPGSAAATASVRAGDVVRAMDEEPVADIADFRTRYEAALERDQALVLLEVKRGALMRYSLIRREDINTTDEAAPDMGGPGEEVSE